MRVRGSASVMSEGARNWWRVLLFTNGTERGTRHHGNGAWSQQNLARL